MAAQLTGRQVLMLAQKPFILSITEDIPVKVTSGGGDHFSNDQRWPYVSRTAKFWKEADSSGSGSGLEAPTIAIVDSGVDAGRADFDGRVVAQVRMTSLLPNAQGDGRGHGTFVASIAAGEANHYAGAVPNADLVSIDVTDDNGMAMTSDVIAACDWILQNKSQYGIRVANFSLHSSQRSTFRFDPLNRAVEKLWFSGVVVVAAAGNYGENESGVNYSPGNDPFVITVGAIDLAGSTNVNDDFAAPWSAHGSTPDGFAKPDLGAPGRYMVGAVSSNTTLAAGAPRSDRGARLHDDFGHVFRRAGRCRSGRLCARGAPELDPGPGQGRAAADGAPYAQCGAGLSGRRRARRGGRGERQQPAESEHRPERLQDPGSGRRLDLGLRSGHLDDCGAGESRLGCRYVDDRDVDDGDVDDGDVGLRDLDERDVDDCDVDDRLQRRDLDDVGGDRGERGRRRVDRPG